MPESRGLPRLMTVDSVAFTVNPETFDISPELAEAHVPTADMGGVLFSRFLEDGFPDSVQRLTFSMGWSAFEGDEGRTARRIASKGGLHTLAVWKPENVFYTAKAGQTQFLLPRYRKYASYVLGFATYPAATYPFRVWTNGVEKASADVLFAAGPTVTSAAGKVTVARDPYTSGVYKDYVEVRFGTALALNDVVEFEYPALYSVFVSSSRVDFPGSKSERHQLQFTER